MSGVSDDAVSEPQTPIPTLLPVHQNKLSQQLLFCFHVSGIPEDAVHKAQTLMPVYCLCISTNLSISCSSVSTWAGSQMMQSIGQTLMQVGFS